MKRVLLAAAVALAAFATGGAATAHECTYDGEKRDTGNQVECHESPAAPNWRDGNYIPLFDLENRDDPRQRMNAQRWREECQGYAEDGSYRADQMCAWARGGYSHSAGHHGQTAPNELHAGFAASHCFLGEFAHQCEDHDVRHGEGVHDKHGGAIYADVCLAENAESKYCKRGMTDTQAGVTVMDHNPCGTIVPVVACIDEYHVLRPFDTEYTEEQMTDSQEYIPRILADPELYLCGYRQYRAGTPVCPRAEDESVRSLEAGVARTLAFAGLRSSGIAPAMGAMAPLGAGGGRIDDAHALAFGTSVPPTRGEASSFALMLAFVGAGVLVRARRVPN